MRRSHGLASILHKLLVSGLVIQLSFPSMGLSSDQGPAMPVDVNFKEVLLSEQWLDLRSKDDSWQSISLSRMNVDLPRVTPADIDQDVRVGIDPATDALVLEAIWNQKAIARHRFAELKPVTWARDREILFVVDQQHRGWSLDMALVRELGFRAPLLQVLSLRPHEIPQGSIQASFLTRGLAPPDNATTRERLRAGTLIFYRDQHEKRSWLKQIERRQLTDDLYVAQGALVALAFRANPSLDAPKLLPTIARLQADPAVRLQTALLSQRLDQASALALWALSPESMEALAARADANRQAPLRSCDVFTPAELRWQYPVLAEQAKRVPLVEGLAQKDLGEHWQKLVQSHQAEQYWITQPSWRRQLFHRWMTPQQSESLRRKSRQVALGSLGVGALSLADQQLTGGTGLDTLLAPAGELWHNWRPPIFDDTAHLPTVWKSTAAILAVLPALALVGAVIARIKGLSSIWQPYAILSHHLRAATTRPTDILKLLRQHSFNPALRHGIAPTTRVKPDTPLGQSLKITRSFFPAFNNPFLTRSRLAKRRALNARAIVAMQEQRAEKEAAIWTASLASLAQSTLSAAPSLEALAFSLEQLEAIATQPAFVATWKRLAQNLQREIKGNPNFSLDHWSKRGWLQRAQLQCEQALSQTTVAIGKFAQADCDFLRASKGSPFVIELFPRLTFIHYPLFMVQSRFLGRRANPHDPQAYAAQEAGPLWTSPGGWFDAADVLYFHLLAFPSLLTLVYDKASPIRENRYDPLELLTLHDARKEGVLQGTKTMVAGALDLRNANYPGIFFTNMQKYFKTLEGAVLAVVILRVAAGGQSLSTALLAFLYTATWRNWQFEWVLHVINRSNQIYHLKIDGQLNNVRMLRQNLGQALRSGDRGEIEYVLSQVDEGYGKSSLKPQEPLASPAPNLELSDLYGALQVGTPVPGQTANFDLMLAQLSEKAQQQPALQIYVDALQTMKTLIEYPPQPTQRNQLVQFVSLVGQAVSVNYLKLSMSVLLFRPDLMWGPLLTETIIDSAALFAGTLLLQRLFNHAWDRGKAIYKNRNQSHEDDSGD